MQPIDNVDLRTGILDADVDPARLEYHLQHEAATRRGELINPCPACGARPIEMKATGLCRACHYNATTEAYRHLTAEQQAEREFASARQQRHRAKDTEDIA